MFGPGNQLHFTFLQTKIFFIIAEKFSAHKIKSYGKIDISYGFYYNKNIEQEVFYDTDHPDPSLLARG